MKLKIYSIFDTAAGAFNNPFFMAHEKQAIRAFANMTNDPNSAIHRNPEDYHLFALGEYDDGTAEFETHQPKLLCIAATLKEE